MSYHSAAVVRRPRGLPSIVDFIGSASSAKAVRNADGSVSILDDTYSVIGRRPAPIAQQVQVTTVHAATALLAPAELVAHTVDDMIAEHAQTDEEERSFGNPRLNFQLATDMRGSPRSRGGLPEPSTAISRTPAAVTHMDAAAHADAADAAAFQFYSKGGVHAASFHFDLGEISPHTDLSRPSSTPSFQVGGARKPRLKFTQKQVEKLAEGRRESKWHYASAFPAPATTRDGVRPSTATLEKLFALAGTGDGAAHADCDEGMERE